MRKTLARSGTWKTRLGFDGKSGGSSLDTSRSITVKPVEYGKPQKVPIQPEKTFRIVTSVENKLVSVNGQVKTELEKVIANGTGLIPDRGGSGYEYLFLLRSEGYAFFLKRLTYHKAHEKVLRRGELRPELCYLLHYLSDPAADDRMLDPFCGSGAIPEARVKYFPCKAVYGADIDLSGVKDNVTEYKTMSGNGFQETDLIRFKFDSTAADVYYRQAGIASLHEWLPPASIDKIITDPPWGLYNAGEDIAALYENMLTQFERVLTDKGVIVLLTAQKELLRELLSDKRYNMKIEQAYDVLVSGKKAGVFVIKR
jgi:predicted RNA methylase